MFTNTKILIIPDGEVVKITSGTSVLWEKVEEVTGRIPREYQEVEWIGNDAHTGTNVQPHLDLGFAFDTKARIEMILYQSSSTTGYIFGAAENSGKLRCMLTSPNNGTTGSLFYGSNGSAYIRVSPSLQHLAWNEFEFILEQGNLRAINKTTGSNVSNATQASYTMTNNLYLFSQNYNGSPRYLGKNQISVFRYYDKNDDLICDLVPCYRKSDGVIGMYDLVREIFLSNAHNVSGVHVFNKGADVTN